MDKEIGLVRKFFQTNKKAISEEDWERIAKVLDKIEGKTRKPTEQEKAEAEELKTRGNELFKEGKMEEALKCYTEALEVDSTNHFVYSNRALVYQKLGDSLKAEQDCYEGIKIEPKFTKFYLRLATIYSEKDKEKALEFVENGLKYEPEDSALLQMKETLGAADPMGTFDPAMMDSLLKNKGLQDMVQNFIKDKSPDELNAMMNSVLGKFGKK